MAKRKTDDGIDRWTSNGYGITVEKPKDKEKEQSDEERETNKKIRQFVSGKSDK